MYRLPGLVLSLSVLAGVGSAARADYLDVYQTLVTPQAKEAVRLLKARNLDVAYLSNDQRILFTYLVDPRRAQVLLTKQASGASLTGGERRGLATINNATNLIATLPKLGQIGFTPNPVFLGH
jgi:hypothetical protein